MKRNNIRLLAIILPAIIFASIFSGVKPTYADSLPTAAAALGSFSNGSGGSDPGAGEKKKDTIIIVGPPIITKDPQPAPPRK